MVLSLTSMPEPSTLRKFRLIFAYTNSHFTGSYITGRFFLFFRGHMSGVYLHAPTPPHERFPFRVSRRPCDIWRFDLWGMERNSPHAASVHYSTTKVISRTPNFRASGISAK